MQRSLLFAFILLFVAAAAAWWAWSSGAIVASPTLQAPNNANVTAPVRAAADIASTTRDVGSEVGVAAERVEATAAREGVIQSDANRLRVIARWQSPSQSHDQNPNPAVDVALRLHSYARGFQSIGDVRTDHEGVATFACPAPGKYRLYSDRDDQQDVEVTGGAQEVVFALDPGITVTGVVLAPNDHRVAGASIWLQTRTSSWFGGSVVARSDADGRFAVEHVPTRLSLGAFAAGFVQSDLIDLDDVDTSRPPIDVTLRLRAGGGDLIGVVVDDQGVPVQGARVGIDQPDASAEWRGERTVEVWSVRSDLTDERGRFRLTGLSVGELPLTAHAAEHGFWHGPVKVDTDVTTEVRIEMQRGGTIRGVVRDGSGAALPGVRISCYDLPPKTQFLAMGQIDFDGAFGHLTAVSDVAGNYTMRGVTPGTAHVFAQAVERRERGKTIACAKAELEIAAGATVEWNPIVSDGHTIVGVARYRDGHAIEGPFVILTDERDLSTQAVNADRNGAFSFTNLAPSSFSLRVQCWELPKGAREPERQGVVPDQGLVELVADFDKPVKPALGTVTGRIDDAGARIRRAKDAYVSLMVEGRIFRSEIVEGAFRFDDVLPGDCTMSLKEGDTELAAAAPFKLLPGATVDVGVLRTLPAGKVHVTVTREPGAEQVAPSLWFKVADGAFSTRAVLDGSDELLVDNLTPGVHEVTIYGDGMVMLHPQIEVVAGATSELSLLLRPGRLVRLSIWLPADNSTKTYRFTIHDGAGHELRGDAGEFGGRPRRPFPIVVTAPPGEWQIEFFVDDVRTHHGKFAVELGGEALEVGFEPLAR